MRRAPAILLVTAALTAGLVSFHPERPALPPATQTQGRAASQTTASSGTGTSASGDRTVSGQVASTEYGPVQVEITLNGGKIDGVTALQLPGADNPRSYEISAYAAPLLRQEALTAQSASIDVVSGATYTSEGYESSLQSALNRAGA